MKKKEDRHIGYSQFISATIEIIMSFIQKEIPVEEKKNLFVLGRLKSPAISLIKKVIARFL